MVILCNHFHIFFSTDETRLRISPEVGGSAYTRGAQTSTAAAKKLTDTYSREEKGNEPALDKQKKTNI